MIARLDRWAGTHMGLVFVLLVVWYFGWIAFLTMGVFGVYELCALGPHAVCGPADGFAD